MITWTPKTPAGAVGPSDTGHNVKPIDQATILVTPIPTDEDEYTTPAFPVPHERDLNDYILVFPADAGMEPIYVYLSEGSTRKSKIDYKSDLKKGDQIDLDKFTQRQAVYGSKGEFLDPKTGWRLSPDRAGNTSHGGSTWKLLDKNGNRIATLDKNGSILRK